MTLSLVAAMTAGRVIGRDNALPWRLPADLKRFRLLTLGHCVLMGRKTFESIGTALPGRTTIVLTRGDGAYPPGVLVAHSIEEALRMAHGEEVFVAGGAQVYEQTLGRAGRLYLTVIDADLPGDAFFPPLDEALWRLAEEERHDVSEGHPYSFRFLTYEKAAAPAPSTR